MFPGVVIYSALLTLVILSPVAVVMSFNTLCGWKRTGRKQKALSIGIAGLALLALYVVTHPNSLAYDLHDATGGQLPQRFEFLSTHGKTIVHDPHARMRYVYGSKPDAIRIESEVVVIVYRESSGIIKSTQDSMELTGTTFRHKGYLGCFDNSGGVYYVSAEGVVKTTGQN